MDTRPNQIIACIDGSTLTESICHYASWVASAVNAPVTLLHTINHHPEMSVTSDYTGSIGLGSQEHLLEEIIQLEQQQSKLKIQQGKQMLDVARQIVTDLGVSDLHCTQRHGDLIEAVIDLEEQIRLLVLGLRGQVHANHEHKIGAKLEAIIRSLHQPILIVTGPFKKPERIMLAYDGSPAADKAVQMVSNSPLYQGMECHLVCVNNNADTADQLLHQAMQKLQSAQHLKVQAVKLRGKPDHELCQYQDQQQIDLTVMGAFSHTRLHDMLLGSFTHKMLVKTHKPLLLLR